MGNRYNQIVFFLITLLMPLSMLSQKSIAPKPLYDDPIYHGAADPVVIYNKEKKKWWMFYTNRRASMNDSTVSVSYHPATVRRAVLNDSTVRWVHGTRIGIAESDDGISWTYLDTANISHRVDEGYTFWAPDIIEHKGSYHMYLTYVPGTFTDWNHPRVIVHLTSSDLKNWKYESTLKLVNEKVIDAAVFQMNDGSWRMWYNNERDGKSIYYADSKDLYNWTDKGKAIAARGEGPKVFYWQGKYFMIIDAWKGMEVYKSDDLLNWEKQASRILENPGTGKDDQAMGGHCDVVVNDGRAFVYYFTHPGRRKDQVVPRGSFAFKRSVIQIAELHYVNGEIVCDRNEPVSVRLKPSN